MTNSNKFQIIVFIFLTILIKILSCSKKSHLASFQRKLSFDENKIEIVMKARSECSKASKNDI